MSRGFGWHWLTCCGLLWAGVAGAASLRVCVDSNPWEPFTYPDRDGLLQTMARMAAERSGDKLQFVALPWRRCEAQVAAGALDAALGAPETRNPPAGLVFPMRGADVDAERALVTTPLVLLTRTGSALNWDGHRVSGLQGAVLYVMGYEDVEERLRTLKLPSDGGAATNELNARKLLAGRSNAMAIYRNDAERLLRAPEFSERLKMLPEPLGQYRYHLVFGHTYYNAHPAQSERLWNALREARDGEAYHALERFQY